MKGNWRKSSYSTADGNCVEVADGGSRVLVRDTKNRPGVVLSFTPAAWRRFADPVKRSLASALPIRPGVLDLDRDVNFGVAIVDDVNDVSQALFQHDVYLP